MIVEAGMRLSKEKNEECESEIDKDKEAKGKEKGKGKDVCSFQLRPTAECRPCARLPKCTGAGMKNCLGTEVQP